MTGVASFRIAVFALLAGIALPFPSADAGEPLPPTLTLGAETEVQDDAIWRFLGAAGLDTGCRIDVADINRDTYADLIVGAPFADPFGRADAGAVYIIFGWTDWPNGVPRLDGEEAIPGVIRIWGAAAGDQLGYSLAYNHGTGSNRRDIWVGAPGATVDSVKGGAVYAIRSGAFTTGDSRRIAQDFDLADPDFASFFEGLYGTVENGRFGHAVAAALNSALATDHGPSCVVSEPGRGLVDRDECGFVHVIDPVAFRQTEGPDAVDPALNNPDMIHIAGPTANLRLGDCLAAADTDGNGYHEIVASAVLGAGQNGAASGEIYLIPLPSATTGVVDLADEEDGVTEGRIYGSVAGEMAGRSLAVGNLSDDDRDDLVIGGVGIVHAVLGDNGFPAITIDLATANAYQIVSNDPTSDFGAAVAVGDLTSDSYPEIVVGAPGTDGGRGAAYIFYNALGTAGVDRVPGDAGLQVHGAAPGDALGAMVAAHADFNRDSIGDLALVAPGAAVSAKGGLAAGMIATVFGTESQPEVGATFVAPLGDRNYSRYLPPDHPSLQAIPLMEHDTLIGESVALRISRIENAPITGLDAPFSTVAWHIGGNRPFADIAGRVALELFYLPHQVPGLKFGSMGVKYAPTLDGPWSDIAYSGSGPVSRGGRIAAEFSGYGYLVLVERDRPDAAIEILTNNGEDFTTGFRSVELIVRNNINYLGGLFVIGVPAYTPVESDLEPSPFQLRVIELTDLRDSTTFHIGGYQDATITINYVEGHDADGDGTPDVEEGQGDHDGDYIPDFLDTDSDDDGYDDAFERLAGSDPFSSESTPMAGDANGDGVLNAVDIQAVINGALGESGTAHTDVNLDGVTNAVDVQLIINAVLAG